MMKLLVYYDAMMGRENCEDKMDQFSHCFLSSFESFQLKQQLRKDRQKIGKDESAQERLEPLLSFQMMTTDVTGLPMSNASLLDERNTATKSMWIQVGTIDMKVMKVFLKDFYYNNSKDVYRVLVQYP